jgi:nucleoside-diphosphate-sugar epimerase
MMGDDQRARDLQVVLGAGGAAGGAVVRELVDQGRRVRAVTCGGSAVTGDGAQPPASYEDCAADVTEPGQLRRALAGATVVYHCAQPRCRRWAHEFPVMTLGIMEAAVEVGAKLVFADNLHACGVVDGCLSEEAPPAVRSKKGRVRAAMAEELLAAHHAGKLRVVVGRSSDCYGPGGRNSPVGERFFRALLAGRKTHWLGDLDQPHTLSYLGDMARALVVLGEHSAADGQVWHTPAAAALTGREFVELAAQTAGTVAKPVVLGVRSLRLLGVFVPMMREFPEMMCEWDRPFVSDASKFEAAFGPFAVTPHGDALAKTIAWYRRNG